MTNPTGDYKFSGLGFTGLRFSSDGSRSFGYLYFDAGENNTPVSNPTYADATGIVTFSVGTSPAGVTDLSFTGSIVKNPAGIVTTIYGSYTGRLPISSVGKAGPVAAGHAEPALQKIGQIPPPEQIHGSWVAYDRQDIVV